MDGSASPRARRPGRTPARPALDAAVAALDADALGDSPSRSIGFDGSHASMRSSAPAIPDPGAIYTIGANYRAVASAGARPDAAAGLRQAAELGRGAPGDRRLGSIGHGQRGRRMRARRRHRCGRRSIFGYTIVNDVTSRRPLARRRPVAARQVDDRLLPGGPVDRHRRRARSARPPARLHDQRRADPGRHGPPTCASRSPRSIAFLGRHVALRPGDLIATGTPARLAGPPDRTVTSDAGDVVTCWIEGIGELTITRRLSRRGGPR